MNPPNFVSDRKGMVTYMEFRDLKTQYQKLKKEMDQKIQEILNNTNFIMGKEVEELEQSLAKYVGQKHCITCANGTDALSLALMAWDIGPRDVVFVPDFTFFSSGEVVSYEGATPVFVDVDKDTYNIDVEKLEIAIQRVIEENEYIPKVIIAVDLFGQPADFYGIRRIANKYGLKVLEDGAQGFGGAIGEQKACSFGDISTTSFFPAKPLGCYGDGGAIFTNDDQTAELLNSLRIHGKGKDKYDNVKIGVNSRLDTIQAAVLQVKLNAFIEYELKDINLWAKKYTEGLKDIVNVPNLKANVSSSWAQYTIQLDSEEQRNGLKSYLQSKGIPSMIYYSKPMHVQKAFQPYPFLGNDLSVTENLCKTVLSLPIHPYMNERLSCFVIDEIRGYLKG